MEHYAWELSVLKRAIQFPNLSLASEKIGISQPQLSRMIAKLEDSLKIVLLERQSKRHSSWTKEAFAIAEIYFDVSNRFEERLANMHAEVKVNKLKIGTLEGLIPYAMELVHFLIDKKELKMIEFNVYDKDKLEEKFLKSELDLIFTTWDTRKRKHKYEIMLGYQTLQQLKKNDKYLVKSSFEYSLTTSKKRGKDDIPTIVSNSLEIRKSWLAKFGGIGTLPSPLSKKPQSIKDENLLEISLIGHETFSRELWEEVQKFTSQTI